MAAAPHSALCRCGACLRRSAWTSGRVSRALWWETLRDLCALVGAASLIWLGLQAALFAAFPIDNPPHPEEPADAPPPFETPAARAPQGEGAFDIMETI